MFLIKLLFSLLRISGWSIYTLLDMRFLCSVTFVVSFWVGYCKDCFLSSKFSFSKHLIWLITDAAKRQCRDRIQNTKYKIPILEHNSLLLFVREKRSSIARNSIGSAPSDIRSNVKFQWKELLARPGFNMPYMLMNRFNSHKKKTHFEQRTKALFSDILALVMSVFISNCWNFVEQKTLSIQPFHTLIQLFHNIRNILYARLHTTKQTHKTHISMTRWHTKILKNKHILSAHQNWWFHDAYCTPVYTRSHENDLQIHQSSCWILTFS